ncbi:hypothetical protein C1I92_02285 [Jiangella anatolica]|uniref:Uncharacterized protein n=2 Tax=Jiangella anatolica TaxID=2670374 RepID=A0A2W2C1T0_9ACTN|nr:hypothetical protein C1I92_02285 [Jiangella anatolica]
MDRCSGIRLVSRLDPVETAARICDHLEGHYLTGNALVDRLVTLRIGRDHTGNELVRAIDRPLIAEAKGGERHAMRPGPVSLDGRGPALCSDSNTVRIVAVPVFGGPVRATAKREPGTLQPDCKTCRRRLR